MKRKSNYNSYSNYKVRKSRVALVAGLLISLVLGLVVFLNFNRISLIAKGYSWSTTSEIINTFEKSDEKLIRELDLLDNINEWLEHSDIAWNYENYQNYYNLNNDIEAIDVVEFIDTLFIDLNDQFVSLGYEHNDLWSLLPQSELEDFEFLIENELSLEDVKNYKDVVTYNPSKTLEYMEAYKEYNDYNYSVLIVNYPSIISSNGIDKNYTIMDPDNILNLVKKGFYLPADYEPSDLVVPNIPITENNDSFYVRKEAAEALEKMYEDALKLDLHLLLNSAYRSYETQQQVYDDYENRYGGLYAMEYVALPGASEHQTGLGIDLTAQRVLDGERMVFGDTIEFKWVVENAHNYGYIVRFTSATSDITGISHEPWHFRYVGEKTAKAVFESGLTYEEYCLYNAVIPILE